MREIESIKITFDHVLDKVNITFKSKSENYPSTSETFTMSKSQAQRLAAQLETIMRDTITSEFKL